MTVTAAVAGAGQNQETDKKRVVRRKSRSRSRSRPKSKERGEKVHSPAQKTAISNEKNDETAWTTPQSSVSKEGTPERTILKLHQLTTENPNTDSSDEASSSDDDDAAQKAVKFHRPSDAGIKQTPTKRSTRGRLNLRRAVSKPVEPTQTQDSSPSPPTTPTRKPNRAKLAQLRGTPPRAAFTTFDFSVLHESYCSSQKLDKRLNEKSKTTPPSLSRKIGGGGIVGISVKPTRENKASFTLHQANHSDTDTDAPCLTIIDFNLLLRKGLDGKPGINERGWKGAVSGKVKTSKTQHASNAANRRCRREVRRRRAILLRGTITDCSPWEDSSTDSDSFIVPISKKLTGVNSASLVRKPSRAKSGKSSSFPASFSS